MSAGTIPPADDIRVWKTRAYKGQKGTTHSVRWRVNGREHHKTFATAKLAEVFRSNLVVAARRGDPFDGRTGLVADLMPRGRRTTWFHHMCDFMDAKWPHASPRHRKSLADGLTTAMCATVADRYAGPALEDQRRALLAWALNRSARGGAAVDQAEPPEEFAGTIRWLERNSPSVEELASSTRLRPVLEALRLNLDGSPASSSTMARKRSALYSALTYAVELDLLAINPMDRVRTERPRHSDVVDRRVVVNPDQAAQLLAAVRTIHPSLEAYFACLYYAGLRPAEARHLREKHLRLPEHGWGSLLLVGSTPDAGRSWTESGEPNEDRQLKHRAQNETRLVPAAPELVEALRRHLSQFPSGPDGRLFVTRTGRAGIPLAGPLAKPQSMGVVYYVWDKARRAALTDDLYESPLAKRPYDLRHAAVSLWLNAGVPATQVAEWAGHSVNVLLRVYAKCVYGQEEAAKVRIEAALTTATRASHPAG